MAISEQTTISLTMRPKDFSEVIGLEESVTTIKALIDSGGVPRAILLYGPYGCGKTTLGLIIAKYIQGPLFDGEVDLMEVNGADKRKIDDFRGIINSLGGYPMMGTYKVVLIDECHQLTKEAKELLLKELEVKKSPVVWILCTTDPGKLNEGIRSRCTSLQVKGMEAAERHILIERAAATLDHTGDLTVFEKEINKQKVVSARKILQAFSLWHFGMSVTQAVAQQAIENLPEYTDIAFSACFGSWDRETTMFAGTVTVKPCGQLLKELDERLKKKPAPSSETEEKEDAVEDDDVSENGKVAAATALRAVLGAFLKGQILPTIQKNGTFRYKAAEQREKARQAMVVLTTHIPSTMYELQWSGTIAAIFRVNQIMKG